MRLFRILLGGSSKHPDLSGSGKAKFAVVRDRSDEDFNAG